MWKTDITLPGKFIHARLPKGHGFPQLLVGHIFNHTDQSVTAIYNQYSYDKEKQQAMEIWTEKIIKIVGLDKK